MEDLNGKKFNKLKVISFAYAQDRHYYWNCLCDCGNTKIVEGYRLKNGYTKSCGCLNREHISNLRKKHGLSKSYIFKVWTGIKARCTNPNIKGYMNYGGRGIKICDEWKEDAKAFYDWSLENGYKKGLSIDRIDNNGDYCPKNCRWIPLKEQNFNKRKSIFSYDGHVYYAEDLAQILGQSTRYVYKHFRRIAHG